MHLMRFNGQEQEKFTPMYVVRICSHSGIHLTQYARLVIGYPDRGPGRVGPVSRQFNPSSSVLLIASLLCVNMRVCD